jgi:SAM-dependent methyltransferase
MSGAPFAHKVAEQKALLSGLTGEVRAGELAVDLGCGSGFQSVALHELGYQVLALDVSEKLLGQLAARVATRGITTRLGGIRKLEEYVGSGSAQIIVCMGDTLTHLSSREEVCELFRSVARALRPGGVFVLGYRDLAGAELLGLERFLSIRGDDQRVMTCFLEYSSPDTVVVNDLVQVREDSGEWSLHKSSYRKLRLPLVWVREQVEAAGLTIVLQRSGPVATLAAVRPG